MTSVFYYERRANWIVLAGSVFAWLPLLGSVHAEDPMMFRDVTEQSGITFRHNDGGTGRRYIVETVSAGLALFDYDNDGDVDVYFLNGAPLQGTKVSTPPTNALYRNDGQWRFTDVTIESGVGDTGYGLGVAAGDYDNDGDQDLYLNNYGPNVLYRNNGDGTFTDVTRETGTQNGSQVGAGTCFIDMDGDGDLDLYVANYLEFSPDRHVDASVHGVPVYPGPNRYRPVPDTLYRNNGDGTFTDISVEAGIGKLAGWGMGLVACDYDNDGDTDIFVGNDVAKNFLFENDGSGKFEEVGLMAGSSYDLRGNPQGSMGVDCGDYNNDGWLDFYQTSYQDQHAVLFENLGGGMFEDVSFLTGAGAGTTPYVTWGNTLADFDNDGDRDIFAACGHLHDLVDRFDDTTSYRAKNVLLMNNGQGKFVNVSRRSGDGLSVEQSSRGAAFDDLDGDGDIDAVILNSREKPTILRNESISDNHWLQVRLRGVKTNRDGVGARVKIVAGSLVQVDEVHSGRGYQSHYGTRLHFGLAEYDRIDRIEVQWIGGGVDVLEDLPTNRVLTITEGSSVR